MRWFRTSIAARLSVIGCAGLVVALASITSGLTVVLTDRARQQQAQWLHGRAEGVATAIDGIDLTSRTMVERAYPVLAASIGGGLSLDPATGRLASGGTVLNDNFDTVDRFTAQTGGVATIFARDKGGFRRIATSLKKQDGARALGTMLDPQGAAFKAVSEGRAYTGRATLFGKPYMTHYEAMRDATNAIVGVLFIGFPIDTFEAAVEAVIQRSQFFDSGGIYLIDPKASLQEAVFTVHPRAKDQKVLGAFPTAAAFLGALASAKDTAIPSPGLLSEAGNDRWAVLSISRSTGQWVIAEVSDHEAMRSHWRTLQWFWATLAMACVVLGAALLWLLRRRIGAPLGELSAAARAVAAGDLSHAFTSDRGDEIGQVIRDVDAMRLRFLSLLTTLRHSSDSIATASAEIAAGNADLSRRTEQSSAHIQQTASSMHSLVGNVTQTASSASAARALAASTLDAAARGATSVDAVVGTMDEICASARKIAEITSVIDGIAFQTNILALNAAVEAARAGDQGRGFAVVATEVRGLARRSADAAKEIKALIGGSVDKVEGGTRLVALAGTAMKDIHGEVQRVSRIIGEISLSATEQAGGIAQVNVAVGQLDQSTQQNSALVEQSAAAAESLKEQALRLTYVLREFRLEESTG